MGIHAFPTTTEFSSTTEPVPISTPPSNERTTAPSAIVDPSPSRADDDGIPETDSESSDAGTALTLASASLPGLEQALELELAVA